MGYIGIHWKRKRRLLFRVIGGYYKDNRKENENYSFLLCRDSIRILEKKTETAI